MTAPLLTPEQARVLAASGSEPLLGAALEASGLVLGVDIDTTSETYLRLDEAVEDALADLLENLRLLDVVANHNNIFERSDGRPAMGVEDAACGCFLGALEIVAYRQGLVDHRQRHDLLTEVEHVIDPVLPAQWVGFADPYTALLATEGPAACITVLDSVIAARRAGEGAR